MPSVVNIARAKTQTEHFVWLVRSPGTVFHWKFVRYLHYQLSKDAPYIFCTFLLHCRNNELVIEIG